MVPLDFAFFADKPVVWLRLKSVLTENAFITEFNKSGLVSFDVFYPYDYLMDIAEWSEDRVTWNEFYTI
ncbi:MAG: hypothetical protein M0P71_16940 [Melioribacteraceae bacterium]|nr:hypothetical protein [Melioribacteraceae bacterium]